MYEQADYSKYPKIDTGLSRVFKSMSTVKSFAVISSYKLQDHINGNIENNYAAHKNLVNEISASSFGSIVMQAGFRYKVINAHGCVTDEGAVHELLLLVNGISYDRAVMLAKKYSQQSILFKDENCFKSVYCRDCADCKGITHYAGELKRGYSTELIPVIFTCYSSDGETGYIPLETELALSKLRDGDCIHFDDNTACITGCSGIRELHIPSRTDSYAAMKKKQGPPMAEWHRII